MTIYKEEIKDYSGGAKNYDSERYTKKGDRFIDSIREKKIRKLLQPNKDMELLDVGTGTGSGIVFFAKDVKNIVGLDATKNMLKEADKKIKEKNIKNAKLTHANALKIPFKDETFDTVISLNFLHLFKPVENQKKFVREMERVVKKGGKVILEIDNVHHYQELGNKMSDIHNLSENLKVKKIVGSTLTKTKRLSLFNKRLASLYAKLASLPFLKRFAHRFYVLFEK